MAAAKKLKMEIEHEWVISVQFGSKLQYCDTLRTFF